MSDQNLPQQVFTERQIVRIQPTSSRFDQHQAVELLNNIDTYASASSLVNSASPTNILIDMQNIEFLDSSGLSVLLSALKAANSKGCNLALCALQYPVRLIFEITKMDQRFEIFDSYEEYKQHLSSASSNARVLTTA